MMNIKGHYLNSLAISLTLLLAGSWKVRFLAWGPYRGSSQIPEATIHSDKWQKHYIGHNGSYNFYKGHFEVRLVMKSPEDLHRLTLFGTSREGFHKYRKNEVLGRPKFSMTITYQFCVLCAIFDFLPVLL